MRVQPHLPRSPLLATVTSRSGLALTACNAANRPAPPAPRIKMSVLRCSMVISFLEHAYQKGESGDGGERRRQCSELFLAIMPAEIFDDQDAQAAEQMHGEEEYECDFAGLDQRLVAPAQESFQSRLTLQCEAERKKVQRQKDRERQSRNPVHHRGPPKAAAAMLKRATDHGSTTAATARSPRSASTSAKKTAQASARRSGSGVHSLNMLRTPIEAWIETASTNNP